MRIHNETCWRTDQIRALVQTVAEREVDSEHRRHIRVEVSYQRRGSWCAGRGTIGKGQQPALRIWLYLHRPERWQAELPGREDGPHFYERREHAEAAARHAGGSFWRVDREATDSREIAHTIAHEFAHNHGLRHREMNRSPRYGHAPGWREFYAWADAFPITQKEQRQQSAEDKAGLSLEHAQATLRRWQAKQKAANTKVKRWTQRVRYYSRRLAALRASQAEAPASSGPQAESPRMGRARPSDGERRQDENHQH